MIAFRAIDSNEKIKWTFRLRKRERKESLSEGISEMKEILNQYKKFGEAEKFRSYIGKWPIQDCGQNILRECTELRFASFLSGGLTTMAVINPPEWKLANAPLWSGWVSKKSYVIVRVGQGKCLRPITRWVGGVKKGQTHAYVIFEWSLVGSKCCIAQK